MNNGVNTAAKWLSALFILALLTVNAAIAVNMLPAAFFSGEMSLSELLGRDDEPAPASESDVQSVVSESQVQPPVPEVYDPMNDFAGAPLGETGLRLVSTGGEYSEEQLQYITEFYSDCVFVGDSVTVQFQKYTDKVQEEVFTKTKFLCTVGLSAQNALWSVDRKDAVHPYYQGEMRHVWDSIEMMGVSRVFVGFWANEFSVFDLDTIPDYFSELIGNIRESSPEAELYLLSPCFIYKGYEGKKLNNKNIKKLQGQLKAYCSDSDVHYVELSKYLGTVEKGQYGAYSSDGKVHMSTRALDVWMRVLKDYALSVETPPEDVPVPEGSYYFKTDSNNNTDGGAVG